MFQSLDYKLRSCVERGKERRKIYRKASLRAGETEAGTGADTEI